MSLKAVHIFFILLSIALAAGFGAWAVRNYQTTGSLVNLWLGIASFACGAALVGYLVWFVKGTVLKGTGLSK